MAPSTIAVLLLLPLLPLLPLSKSAQAQSINPVSSSLTADDQNSSWKSPNGDFAFGFQRIPGSGFLLAIWFDQIPEKTIIWWANWDNSFSAPEGSKVELTERGLNLTDPYGVSIWSQGVDNGTVSHASMLDTGNFFLLDEAGSNLWGTFSQPTDTIVPKQVLDQGSDIVSRSSNTSYTSGRFMLAMQSDGNLVMYTLPKIDSSNAYWSTDTVGSGYRVIFNETGPITLVDNNGSVLIRIMPDLVSSENSYQRAVLDYDGVFRQYSYPKNSSTGWSTGSTLVPSNICKSMRQLIGAGACGFNSYCAIGVDLRPTCICPRGYTYVDPLNEMNGCKKDFQPHSCQAGIDDSKSFTIEELSNVNWPFNDYERLDGQTKDTCKQACLSDCNCDVAIFGGSLCWKKRMPISNGRADSGDGAIALIKVRILNSTLEKASEDKNVLIIVGSVLLGSSVFVNFILMCVIGLGFLLIFRKNLSRVFTDETALEVNIRCFTYRELEDATNGFKEELGRGSFGIVYKGVIEMGNDSNSRTEVAVKKLDRMFQESEREFKTEVIVIGQTHHKNLVRLLGYCNEGQNRLLVYECLSNGTLASFLFGNDMKPSWDQRVQIALDIGKGLLYLHEECSSQIIHCDIKPQNILLDDNYGARISDFGLAKLLRLTQSQTNTAVRGTRGYVAPEWFRSMPITVKVDVYSFGILLLEIICCRRSVDINIGGEEMVILADWAYDCYRERRIDSLVENDEEATNDIKRLERFVMVAIWCIQEDPSLRPTVKKVMLMLEGIIQVAVPPCPFPFSSTMSTV